ncbi:MAG TPA: hypothetical protein VJY62_18550 [Bacteroidia bacterium]|nr:hypothetical protein [Bacteroidia bacterium]
MNHFKSLKIGNSPLLMMGCTIIAFGVTHFYFANGESPKIAIIIGHILLFPVYLVDGIVSFLDIDSILSNPIAIFLVLFITYSCIVVVASKIFEWRRSGSE